MTIKKKIHKKKRPYVRPIKRKSLKETALKKEEVENDSDIESVTVCSILSRSSSRKPR